MKKDEHRLTDRATWEDKHHSQFDYKEQNKRCLECGETNNRHTYTCIYFDRDKK